MKVQTIIVLADMLVLLAIITGIITIVEASEVTCQPPPAVEGYTHTIKWSSYCYQRHVYVRRYDAISYKYVARCNTQFQNGLTCEQYDDQNFEASITETSSNFYEISLTIWRVERWRDAITWILYCSNGYPNQWAETARCKLNVFSPCPHPAKEGSSYSMSQVVGMNRDSVFTWKYYSRTSAKWQYVSRCYKNDYGDINCKNDPDNSWSSSTIKSFETYGYYNVTLTIQQVSRLRDETFWKWYHDDTLDGCFLSVYSYDSTPVCNSIRLTDMGTNNNPSYMVTWMCSISNVYPRPVCQFEYKTGSPDYTVLDHQYVSEKSSGIKNGGLYDHFCNLTLPVKILKPDNYSFQVNVIWNTQVMRKHVASKNLILSSPVSATGGDCPLFIRKGTTTKTCLCYLTFKGNPPAEARWFDIYGAPVDGQTREDGSSTLRLGYSGVDQEYYYCAGTSALDIGPKTHYRPEFAHGPTHVLITVNNNIPTFTKCPAGPGFFSVFCDVDKSSTNPKPKVTLTVPGIDNPQVFHETNYNNNNIEYYRFEFRVFPTMTGPLAVQCVAQNTEFPKIKSENKKKINVQTKSISFNNKNKLPNGTIVYLSSGDTYQLRCTVEGEYSPTSITCSGTHGSLDGNDIVDLTVDSTMDGYVCVCQTKQFSDCYMKTQIILSVHLKDNPVITKFVANSDSSSLTVEEDDEVQFQCLADGDPMPNITIRGQRSMKYLDTLHQAKATKRMTCQDSDDYTCHAANNVRTVNESVTVYVRCAPELLSNDTDTKDMIATPGFPLEVKVPIIGYPTPQDYTLTKLKTPITETEITGNHDSQNGHNSRVRRALVIDTIGEMDYNVTYESDGPGKGTVVVTMSGFEADDSGQYVLHIKNGLGNGLNHSFTVIVTSDYRPSPPGGHMENGDSGNGSGDGNDIVIIGVTAGVVVIIAVVVLIVVVIFKRKGKLENTSDKGQESNDEHDRKKSTDEDFVEINNDIYGMDKDPNEPSPYYGDASNNDVYTELNEDEITTIRKASVKTADDVTYQNCANPGKSEDTVDHHSPLVVNSLGPDDKDSQSENDYVII